MTNPPRARRSVDWRAIVGIALSVGFLAYALRDVDPREVMTQLRRADPALFLLAVAAATLPFWIRAWRWRALLAPVAPSTSFRSRFGATTIGFMANNLLPARVGEFLRAWVISRLEPIPVVASLGSLVLERLFDGLTLVAYTFVALAAVGQAGGEVGRSMRTAATGLGIAFAIIAVVLLAMLIWPRRVVAAAEAVVERSLPRAFRRPVVDALETLIGSLGAIRDPGLLARVVAWSAFLWLVGAFSYWLGLLAFGIRVPFTAALFLQSIVSFAVAVPSSPGFFGVFEFAVKKGLVALWAVDPNRAIAFAVGFHLGGFIPVNLIGLFYLWRLGFSWRDVKAGERTVEEQVEAALPSARHGGER
ncbi:MAG: flippase-like domain-containing protein [Gemmatimonadetes bacterium]|nr:flippase-like domain-containing protein [Gemmatimonadota bacterium]